MSKAELIPTASVTNGKAELATALRRASDYFFERAGAHYSGVTPPNFGDPEMRDAYFNALAEAIAVRTNSSLPTA